MQSNERRRSWLPCGYRLLTQCACPGSTEHTDSVANLLYAAADSTVHVGSQVTSFCVTGAEGGSQQHYAVLAHCRGLLRNLATYEHPFNEQVSNWKSAADHLHSNVKV